MTRRILHVSQPVEAGCPAVLLRYVAAQLASGDEVVVAAPGDPLLARARALGAQTHVWNATRSPGPHVVTETRRLDEILRRVQPDLVHLHSAKAGLAGRLALRGRLPTVFQPHAWSFDAVSGPIAMAARGWEQWATRWTDLTICVSEREREVGREAGIAGRSVVVPNVIDLAHWPRPAAGDRDAARERLGLPVGIPLAVCIGRLSPQKGQDVLLDAWPRVRSQHPTAELILVGDGPDRASLEERARTLAGVRFVGARDDVREWHLAATVVIVPSRWEGMALVPLEAQATGRSVVASTATGLAESVAPGTGAVVELKAEAFAAEISARLDGPLADDEGRQGRLRAESVSRGSAESDLHAAYALVSET